MTDPLQNPPGKLNLLRYGLVALALGGAICVMIAFRGMQSASSKNLLVSGDVSTENIIRSLHYAQNLGNRITLEKQWEMAHWLRERFQEMGVPASLHTYVDNGKTWPNVIAEIKGNGKTEQKILLLAHLDSIKESNKAPTAPGADDNGSGIAVLLELARILSASKNDRNITFCIFSNEEQGHKGSVAYAKAQRKADVDIKAVINLDILGYSRPTFPLDVGSLKAIASWESKYKAARKMLANYLKGFHQGDQSLKVAGRPANSLLVNTAASILAEDSGISVIQSIKDDCG